MIASDTIGLAIRNLRQSVLRTVLTSLGVAIGIASLVGMVSFGVAMQDQVVGGLMRSGVFDTITVTPETFVGRGRQGRAPRRAAPQERRKLDDAALKALSGLERVKEVYPDLRVPVQVVYGEVTEVAAARGVPMSARADPSFRKIDIGRFFRDESEAACLISLDFARRITDKEPKTLLGKQVALRYVSTTDLAQLNPMFVLAGGLNIQRTEKKFTIVGIVERQGGPNFLTAFSPVMIPMALARQMGAIDMSDLQKVLQHLGDSPSYTMVVVRVNRPQDVDYVERKIKAMGFGAFSIADALEGQKKAFVLLDLFLGLVGSIALTVASLGIVNTMVMSILERTREIGVMKAIGASDRDVRRIFLIEASLIGVIGGMSGIVLGWTLGRVINAGANYYVRSQGLPAANLFLMPPWLLGGAVGFAILVSLIAGSFPAARAARLDPIRALRHD